MGNKGFMCSLVSQQSTQNGVGNLRPSKPLACFLKVGEVSPAVMAGETFTRHHKIFLLNCLGIGSRQQRHPSP